MSPISIHFFTVSLVCTSSVLGLTTKDTTNSLTNLERRLLSTYEALPRGTSGLPDAGGVRYLAQRFFSAEYNRWVHGLDRVAVHGSRNATELAAIRAAELLQVSDAFPTHDKQAILAVQRSSPDDGFTLQQAAGFVRAVENMLAHADLTVMRRAYTLAKRLASGSSPKLRAVLLTFATLHMSGTEATDLYSQGMKSGKARRRLDEEIKHTVERLHYDINGEPLESVLQSAEEAIKRSARVAGKGGQASKGNTAMAGMELMREKLDARQKYECRRFRGLIQSMDTEGRGQVGYRTTFGVSMKDWALLETPEYLHAVGALSPTYDKGVGPGVIIPNYVAGMNSCRDAVSWHAANCCPDECELEILPRLERLASGSYVDPGQLWKALEEPLSAAGQHGPRARKELRSSLARLANSSADGRLELHGHPLGSWLHAAFPHKCRKPLSSGSPLVVDPALQPTPWDKSGRHLPLDPEEVAEVRGHLQRRWGKDGTGKDIASYAARSHLSLDEEIKLIHRFFKVRKAGGPPVERQMENVLRVQVLREQPAFVLHIVALLAAAAVLVVAGLLAKPVAFACLVLEPPLSAVCAALAPLPCLVHSSWESCCQAATAALAPHKEPQSAKHPEGPVPVSEKTDEDSTDTGETDSEVAGEPTSDSEVEDPTKQHLVYSRLELLRHWPGFPAKASGENPSPPVQAHAEEADTQEDDEEPAQEAQAVCAPAAEVEEPTVQFKAPPGLPPPGPAEPSPGGVAGGGGLLSGPVSLRPAPGRQTGCSLLSELTGSTPKPVPAVVPKGEGSWRSDAATWRRSALPPTKPEAQQTWRAPATPMCEEEPNPIAERGPTNEFDDKLFAFVQMQLQNY